MPYAHNEGADIYYEGHGTGEPLVLLHGEQEKAHFHSYYDNYCYLPLYVFCGQDLLACVLRPSSRDPAGILSALIKLLAQRLRAKWPNVRLIVRGDSGFCRPAALRRFEKWGVHYLIGLQKNAALLKRVELAGLASTLMINLRGPLSQGTSK